MFKVYDSEVLTPDEQKSLVAAIGTRAYIPVPSRVYALGRVVGYRSAGRKAHVAGGRLLTWPAVRIARHTLPKG